jgi:glycosyltransferase involved in cell wall biosynthesis
LVERGHRVTWFASDFPFAPRRECIDGIDVVRGGNAVTVRAHAFHFYRSLRGVDILVDEINTLPFFTPLYAREPVVAFICQLARDVWFYEAPAGIAQVGYAIEPAYLLPYRRIPILTISRSSAESLRREMGFAGEIGVMPMAIDQYEALAPLRLEEREDTIVALGRVTPSKRLDHTIRALALLKAPLDKLRLQIVGSGSVAVRERLDHLAESLGVIQRVEWAGFLSEAQKRDRLRRAKALVMNSVREGWGLAVSEANLAGTPAVAYGVLGLRDSIKNGLTGVLTEETPEALAQGLENLLRDPKRYSELATSAQMQARFLTWDTTTTFVEHFLAATAKGR